MEAGMASYQQVPSGMVVVSKEAFFEALRGDPQDIMPSNRNPVFTTWETKDRVVWGWSHPGWKNPRGRKVYAMFPRSLGKVTV